MRRHFDTLTDREREVLGLVRLGLTNEEIAQRLGITLDGAKYHVSQILSKLGVDSREEAAVVAAEGRRRWWLAAPLWAKIAGAATVAAAVGGLVVLVWGVLSTGDDTEVASDLSLEQTYGRVSEGITRPGFVLHSTLQVEGPSGDNPTPHAYTADLWIDTERQTVRTHFVPAPGFISEDMGGDTPVTSLVVGTDAYRREGESPATKEDPSNESQLLCPGTDDVYVSRLLGCPGPFPISLALRDPDPPRVEANVEFGGRPAVALVFEGTETSEGTSATPEFTIISRLYLDDADFLPIAWVAEFRFAGEKGRGYEATYENEFVRADSLADGFLEPRSLGYPAEDTRARLDELQRLSPVYWLSQTLDLPPDSGCFSSGDCSIALARTFVGSDFGNSGELQYESPSGNLRISIVLWDPQPWKENLAGVQQDLFVDDRCFERAEIPVGGRLLVIYRYPLFDAPAEADCRVRVAGGPEAPTETFAYVELEEVAVELRTNRSGGPGTVNDLRTIVEQLQRR